MKKIFVFVLMCFYLSNVQALEYSAYSDYSDFTEEVITGSDLVDVKKERRYKYYKLKKILGPYEEKNHQNEDFPYVDLDDALYTEESSYLTSKPEDREDRIITEYEGLHYKKVKGINKVQIASNNSYNYPVLVKNILMKYKGENIPYEAEYVNADAKNIQAGGYIVLSFSQKYDIKDIIASVYVDCAGENGTMVSMTMMSDDLSIYSVSGRCANNPLILPLNYNESFVGVNCYDHFYTLKENSLDSATLVGDVTLYTYKDILYRKYNLEKEYYDKYLSEAYEDYIYKDELDYKDFYAARYRTLLERSNDNVFSLDNKPIVIKNAKLIGPNKLDNNDLQKFDYKPLSNSVKGNLTNDIDDKTIKKFPLFLLLLGIIILFLSKQYKKKH